MQLFAEMINSGAAPSQPGAPLSLQELAALALGSGQTKQTTDTTDSDTDDPGSEDAGALAMAALLPGMSCLVPVTANSAATTTSTGQPGADVVAAIGTARVAIEATQVAMDQLADDTAEPASSAPAPIPDATTASSTQSASNAAQFPALLASHAALDTAADNVVSSPVGAPAWKDELGAQLTWMAANGREAASLTLTPEHLGPLEIRISVHKGEASVWFGATNADTRSALEQSLPRLRELFASQGLVLADAGVFRDSPRNQFRPATFAGGSRSSSDAGIEQSVTSVTLVRAGLVDTYV
jgi:flagellar hook-length control protein FliK